MFRTVGDQPSLWESLLPEEVQRLPQELARVDVEQNTDGSIDLYLGPTKPEGVPEKNWIQTLAGHAILLAIRLYGSGVEFYDQIWRPDDVVKLK